VSNLHATSANEEFLGWKRYRQVISRRYEVREDISMRKSIYVFAPLLRCVPTVGHSWVCCPIFGMHLTDHKYTAARPGSIAFLQGVDSLWASSLRLIITQCDCLPIEGSDD